MRNDPLKKKHLYLSISLTTVMSLLLISCTETLYSSVTKTPTSPTLAPLATIEFKVSTMQDLDTFFEEINYSQANWNNASWKIPRITFDRVGPNWVNGSPQLPVDIKKSIFFRLMTPLILIANENILHEREIVENAPLDAPELVNIALKYRIIKNENTRLTSVQRDQLLIRVDILPASLGLAQAAEESGWGTSRFALEGNAFFGQWDFSGNGMKPKQQRTSLGNYGVARFDSPFDSVEAYMFNINTNQAYQDLRTLRATHRNNNRQISGYQLATTLNHYSERGEAYSNGLRQLIRYNKLESVDDMLLSNGQRYRMISASQ